jgi:hypothetical protein
MRPRVLYTAREQDLLNPGLREGFFPAGARQSEAILCAGMARLAYCRKDPDFGCDQDRVRENLQSIGFKLFACPECRNTARGNGSHCVVALREDPQPSSRLAVVAFRGTEVKDGSNLLYDADLELEPWTGEGRVHKGFATVLGQVQEEVLAALDSLKGCRVLYTGHSLGAAMATLLAGLKKPDALFTFGSPRVGDARFAASLQAVTNYRFQDCCDLVTRVPPEEFGYQHFGAPHYIDRKRRVTLNPDEKFVSKDHRRARWRFLLRYAWRPGNVRVRELADHAPMNYVWPVAAAHD